MKTRILNTRRIVDLSRPLADADLSREFRALGEILVADPLGAYR